MMRTMLQSPLRIGVNSGAPEGLVAPAPPVAPVVFLLFLWPHNETNFIHFIYTLVITKSCINHTSWVPSGDILDVIISEKNTVGFYMWEPFMKNTCYQNRVIFLFSWASCIRIIEKKDWTGTPNVINSCNSYLFSVLPVYVPHSSFFLSIFIIFIFWFCFCSAS
jgi:hypothetical protein